MAAAKVTGGRYYRRDDGRVCIIAPTPGSIIPGDTDQPPAGSYPLALTMACGGTTYPTHIAMGPPTCLGCIARAHGE